MRRILVAIVVLALAGAVDRACANYASFNLRAVSAEGKAAARCLSSEAARACRWSGWRSWAQLKATCPQVTCMGTTLGQRYALSRPTEGDVVAVGVDTYETMRGDAWLGVGGEALHCRDTTWMPSPIEGMVRGTDRALYLRLSDDGRCARLGPPPPDLSLRAP